MALRTKSELLALFADNTSGDISAEDLRDFVDSNLALDIQTIALAFDTVLDKSDLVYLSTGANIIELPDIANFKNRALIIYSDTIGLSQINAAAGQSIESQSSRFLKTGDSVTIAPQVINPNNWALISTRINELVDLRDTPISYLGQALKYLRVNATADATEFVERSYAGANEEGNALTTTINVAGTFEPINCNMTGSANDFTIASNAATYTGADTKPFLFTFSVSVSRQNGVLSQLVVKAFIDGTTGIPGQCSFNATDNGVNENDGVGVVSGFVELANGESIEIEIANVVGTTD